MIEEERCSQDSVPTAIHSTWPPLILNGTGAGRERGKLGISLLPAFLKHIEILKIMKRTDATIQSRTFVLSSAV
jgi:hypothetical protein